jgi:predicted unusual protein kinase regulating ubiquinone biosynthesis (AarF/ABC1/UbiB family)
MALSLKPKHLKRYKDIAWLLVKYGRADLVSRMEIEDALSVEERPTSVAEGSPKAEDLARDLERLGPTYVKLGQLLSTQAELLPLPYIEALARLQDKVEPFSFAEVEEIVSSELHVRISKAFTEFEATPLAAASLGQVHRAVRDGREVAVKVQRPAIRERIIEDLEAFAEIADFLDRHTEMGERFRLGKMLEEFQKTLMRELDYRQEAANLVAIGKSLEEFDRILIPRPVEDYTTGRVLTMDFIRGTKITALSPLERIELKGGVLAEELFRAYLKQILIEGLFHADPHPGNVFVTEDHRLVLIDLGMVARISPGMQEKLLKLLLAVSEGRGEEAAARAEEIGEKRGSFDEREFRRKTAELVALYEHATIEEIQVGKAVLEIARVSGETGLSMPSELTMLGKTLLHLDRIGRTLDPQFDPNASIRNNAAQLLRRRMWKSASPANLAATLLEAKEFLERLPGRVNKVLDIVSNNELRLHVDAIDEDLLIEGFQKVANRITMGLILAALIVGAAMFMRVETSFRIAGYPGLAMLCFLGAAGGGVALVLSIVLGDRKRSRKKNRN